MNELDDLVVSVSNKIVIASSNKGKIAEMKMLLKDLPLDLCSQDDLGINSTEETGSTFLENALIKARSVSKQANSAALADDSGICVPALAMRPGILSARYASVGQNKGELNNKKQDNQANIARLLSDMQELVGEQRRAFFHCTLVLIRHSDDPVPLLVEANWWGRVTLSSRGQGGFGYDPLFIPNEYPEITAAQLSAHQKNAISHRGKAMVKLVKKLEREWFL